MAARARLEKALFVFGKWLYLPDPGALEICLATVAANRMKGDPVWLLLTGAASGGKTELLAAFGDLPNMYPLATLTEASLLSGTPAEKSAKGTGGLLRVVGNFGILVLKDFTSVLAMNRDKRSAVLAAMREIYDGSWVRGIGTDGGRTLAWEGKLGIIGGVTSAIDSHHSVMSAMGQRLALFRLPETDGREQARRVIGNTGDELVMRAELKDAVCEFFSELDLDNPPALSTSDHEWLIALTTLVVRCRSAVERDGYSHEIELIHDAEAPGRLTRMLAQLLIGLRLIGVGTKRQRELIVKVGFDCIHPVRRLAFEALIGNPARGIKTDDVAAHTRYPVQTIRRALHDLRCHGIVECVTVSKAEYWDVVAEWREVFERACGPFPKC